MRDAVRVAEERGMGAQKDFDLIVAGNLAIDLIISPRISAPKPTLGGPPTYASLSARNLDARVAVVSKVGGDFPDKYLAWLKRELVDVSHVRRVADALTTRFVLKYTDNERQLRLEASAPSILPDDFPDDLRARAVHVAPIANEVPLETFNKLRGAAETLALDPQGFVRGFDELGNVRMQRWRERRILGQVDIYKSSLPEIRAVTGVADLRLAMKKIHDFGARVVIVTKGAEGSALSFEGSFYEVPPCPPRRIADQTGAGDAFIGAFLAEYVRGGDPLWCAYVGSATASFVVEEVGPANFGSREEVYARAMKAYGERTKCSLRNV